MWQRGVRREFVGLYYDLSLSHSTSKYMNKRYASVGLEVSLGLQMVELHLALNTRKAGSKEGEYG
jgi:hypothetical protein